MTTQRATVVGVFTDPDRARAAVSDLRQAGFRDDQIGLITRTADSAETALHASTHQQFKEKTGLKHDPTHSHWEEGAAVGAAAGAATGVGLGLAVAAGLIPGLGPVLAGGTLVAILASAGTGAAVGSILGGLVGLGVPEEEASYYDTEFKSGRTIVTVRADERSADAWNMLVRHGAYDYERRDDAATLAGTGLTATPY
jgi:hypothetical protein